MLKDIPGVASAQVDFDSKTATVECSDAVTPEIVTKTIDASGQFTAELKN